MRNLPSRHLTLALMVAFLSTCKTPKSVTTASSNPMSDYEEDPIAFLNENKPRICGVSDAPFFKSAWSQDHPQKILVKADFAKLWDLRNRRAAFGVIYYDKADKPEHKYIPVYIEPRGKSRGRNCPYGPVKFNFILFKADHSVEETDYGIPHQDHTTVTNTIEDNREWSDVDKVKAYYHWMQGLLNGKEFYGGDFAQEDGSLFDKLKDDVKIVTHCGFPKNGNYLGKIGGGTLAEQNARVRGEHYVYRLLDQLHTTIIKSSLVEINYISIDNKSVFEQPPLAIVLEPLPKLAKRCGLLTAKEKEDDTDEITATFPHNTSSFHAGFLNQFVASTDYAAADGHNIKNLYEKRYVEQTGKHIADEYYSIYDFDLSLIIDRMFHSELEDINPLAISEAANRFKVFLDEGNYGLFYERAISMSLYLRSPRVKNSFYRLIQTFKDESDLERAMKQRFIDWHEKFYQKLDDFIDENREFYKVFITTVEEHLNSERPSNLPNFN